MHAGNFHRNGYFMPHHLASATIQAANLVNYNCHPREDGKHIQEVDKLFLVFVKTPNRAGPPGDESCKLVWVYNQ